MVKFSPSILTADFVHLGEAIEELDNAKTDMFHLDVMDGIFVPNISIGIPVVDSIRKATDTVLDVHLMIDRPHRYIEQVFISKQALMLKKLLTLFIHSAKKLALQLNQKLLRVQFLNI